MPKIKPSTATHLKQIISEFGEDIFSTDGKILFCKICEVKVAAEKRFTVQQHIGRDKHKNGIQNISERKTFQVLLAQSASTSKGSSSKFYKELCEVLVSANIPLCKLNNFKLRDFLGRYTGHSIPDESTLRKNYIPQCYEETIRKIRERVCGKKIFVSIDESSDVEGRLIASVIVGTLEIDKPGEIFLLTVEVLESVNHSTICRLFDRSMVLLWPEGVRHDDVLLFVTDAAPYIVKAAKAIKAFYSKMIHVTCLAHAFHRVAEEVRANFPEIDKLVSHTKKVFVKAPTRRQLFKSQAPDIPLPPEPIITRWGTWIDACVYYCDYFQLVKRVVDSLEAQDARAIQIVQELFSDSEMQGRLAYIKANFGSLSTTITRLQERGVTLEKMISLVRTTEGALGNVRDCIGELVSDKLKRVLDKNLGYKVLCSITRVLTGEDFSMTDIEEELTSSDIVCFKYAPIASVDVERSFSMYKNVLADNRRSFTFENLRMVTVIYCNAE